MALKKLDSNGNTSVSEQENGFADSVSVLNSEKAVQEKTKIKKKKFGSLWLRFTELVWRCDISQHKVIARDYEEENGLLSVLNSEKAVQKFIKQPLIEGNEDNLIEFSEAMRTVAKTLRRATEGKASAQAEAAEWKHKYELEKARNHKMVHKDLPLGDRFDEKEEPSKDQAVLLNQGNELTYKCCGKNGIFSFEVLQDGERNSNGNLVPNKIMRKASIRLSWSYKGKNCHQHKHDVVSFNRGDITTAERSSKQISLKWETRPQTVLVMTKPNSTPVRILCAEMIRWLKEQKMLDIFVEPRVREELLTESADYNFVQTWKDDDEILLLHMKVDLVVTLGGDGTVLWEPLSKGPEFQALICIGTTSYANPVSFLHLKREHIPLHETASMFKGPVPPIVPFSLGSLGFMTPFYSERYKECLDSVLKGPINITLRHRLQCHVIRDLANSEYDSEETIIVLNEVTIDCGSSSFLTNLECYCDSSFVTRVQGDGLILSTTSGSTAYSLAAGGSMVHPQVPGILFTPICPHSLSFRPLILPEHVTLRVQVPLDSKSSAWASFDGKNRKMLAPGDALICSMAAYPVPTACPKDSTSDFFRSIHDGLHWNLRKTQGSDGPRDINL